MRRSKWIVGLVASALTVAGCGQESSAPEAEGPGSVTKAPLEAAWAVGVAYSVGTRVTYEGRVYECRQAHTSQADWTPTAVAALWLDLGPVTGGGDTTAPVVTASSSSTSVTAAGSITISGSATDNVGVTKIEILENGTLVATASSYTRGFSGSGQNGTYTYTVKAYDAAGNVGTKTVSVEVELPGTPPPPGGKKIVGYFTAWGIYGRNYQVSNVPASKLTHINYAFSNISPDGKCILGDPFADIDKGFGYPGEWDPGALRGNFRAFKELKKTNPNLKLLISIGGWSWSKYFSQVAATAASRTAFVKSCVDLYVKGQFPGVTPANGVGVFDGIDVDWEYPTGGGLPDNISSPADKVNYTLLMQEFRTQLAAVTSQTGQPYLLTIASGASPDLLANKQETVKLAGILDWINVMSYDYHGAFESTVNFHSALNRVTGDPGANDGFYTDGSIARMLQLGVPASKIVVGVPFYGRGWGNVPNVNNGLFQSGVPTKGTWDDGQSGLTGVFDYKDLKANYERAGSGYSKFFHPESKQAYLYSPTTKVWVAYDDVQSMNAKSDYILAKGLGGAMFWELSGDDGSLVNALYDKLH
ncbi:glycosyl hydrolase [Corallococcus sp. AB049A]|uniref:glycosyl hydrolase family 18 protein n=1 Tax=Corallococcus sp. AB049A TaxID=2316721 RepID=UPI000ED6F09F|nr:glycosyl hydrolase family 18 protein [Corallococcus sp. AB049A]RKI71748.1 glycosyl hydrolase [Corallococcus sp. AB049A]